MEYGLGIDVGTTFTAAAVTTRTGVEICTLGTRAAAVPTVVLVRADGEVLVGEAAERRAVREPERAATAFKRRLGDPTPIVLGGAPYGAETLVGHVLGSVVRRITDMHGAPPAHVVLTHPAGFGQYKLDLLRQAARYAGLDDVDFVAEPQAAAVHYADTERLDVGSVVAVYDFGGGTFDAALLRRTPTGFEVIGRPEGLERIGGIDLDHAVLLHVLRAVGLENLDQADDPDVGEALARLRAECRTAKEALSSDADASVSVAFPNLVTQVRITRPEFEDMVRPRIADTIDALRRAVHSADLELDQVDRILLVGGTSRIPLVAEMVRAATGRPVAVDVHAKHSVAMGAAALTRVARRPLTPPAPPAPVGPTPPDAASPAAAGTPSGPGSADAASGQPRRRTIAVVTAVVAAVLAVVAIAVVSSRSGDSAAEGSSTTAATGTEPSEPLEPSSPSSPSTQPSGSDVETTADTSADLPATEPDGGSDLDTLLARLEASGDEPLADLLPRSARYGGVDVFVERVLVHRQDPAALIGGIDVAADGPRWAYALVTANNALEYVPVSLTATGLTLRLADGTSITGEKLVEPTVLDPGGGGSMLVAFELGDGDLTEAGIVLTDPGDTAAVIGLGAAELPADEPIEIVIEAGVAVVGVDGITTEWGMSVASSAFDAAHDTADGAGGQPAGDRRAADGSRFVNLPISINAAEGCNCDGAAVDSSIVTLEVGGAGYAAVNSFAEYVAPGTFLEVLLSFEVPLGAAEATLRIGDQSVAISLP